MSSSTDLEVFLLQPDNLEWSKSSIQKLRLRRFVWLVIFLEISVQTDKLFFRLLAILPEIIASLTCINTGLEAIRDTPQKCCSLHES